MGGGGRGGGEEGRGEGVVAVTAAAGPGGRVSHGSKERKNRQAVAGGCSMRKGDVVVSTRQGQSRRGAGHTPAGRVPIDGRRCGNPRGHSPVDDQSPPAWPARRPAGRLGATRDGAAWASRALVPPPRLRSPPKAWSGNRHGHRVLPSAAAPLSPPPVSSTFRSVPRQTIRSPRGHGDDRKSAVR